MRSLVTVVTVEEAIMDWKLGTAKAIKTTSTDKVTINSIKVKPLSSGLVCRAGWNCMFKPVWYCVGMD